MRQWWSEPVDYAAQVAYFAKRSMSQTIKVAIGLGNGMNAATPLALLLPTVAPDKPAARIAVVMFAVMMFVWAWLWCSRPWPSRSVSIGFIVSCDIGIAMVSLQDPNWLTGFWGFNAFAQISVYLLFFDGPKVFAVHGAWIVATATAFAARISADAHVGAAVMVARLLAIVVPAVSATMGIQLGIWDLRNDANESLTDPLTGLLNRRGLHLHIGDLLRDNTTMASEVAVMVVDLDRFKQINDNFGHGVGDEVLIRTAQRITAAVRGSALVARTGGEEFVIVDLTDPGRAEFIAERIRYAIAAPAAHPATASIGLSCSARADFTTLGGDPTVQLDAIIARADSALFDAKRRGGNATINIPAANDQH
ncbi:GGDEF domain-containing protein [Mycobacterium sp. MAA66]|uniref:GGDEF domain-containing protein n=1 Tax=Mycobacterium sp. MAA66 TaxID=3156297 RepID=UPI003514DE7E